MTRREWVSLCLAVAAKKCGAQGQDPYPGLRYKEYSRCLNDYLETLAKGFHEQRIAEIASLQYINKVYVRQRDIRRTLWRLIGGMPARTDLDFRTTGSLTRDGYKVEKLVYESSPGLFVTANLYLPLTPGPHPAVLFQCGHAALGKAEPEYQRCCQALACLGCVVLSFDPIGQGERVCYPLSDGRATRLGDPIYEHLRIGQQLLLWGGSITHLLVWDAIRSLDVLAGHPAVDPRRIGVMGHSGGGTMTMWLAALDERPAAAVLACAATENFLQPNFRAPGAINDAEQNLIGAAPLGLDRWDLLLPFAPKPLAVLVSASDNGSTYSPHYLESGWDEFKALRSSYSLMNAAEDLLWSETALPHPLGQDLRTQIAGWFSHHLHFESIPSRRYAVAAPEEEKDLWASPGGRVLSMTGAMTPLAIRRSMPLTTMQDWAGALQIESPPPGVQSKVLRRTEESGYRADALEVQSVSGVLLPCWLFLPNQIGPSSPLVITLDDRGKNRESGEAGYLAQLARKGVPVVSADLRGFGELSPTLPGGPPGYARWRERDDVYAWCALVLGKPLLGQQVTDLLWLLRAIERLPDLTERQVVISARGALTVVASLAAPLVPKPPVLALHAGLVSFHSLGSTEDPTHPFSVYVPKALQCPDLPAVCSGIEVALAGMLEGNGAVAPLDVVRKLYSGSRLMEVTSDPNWLTSTAIKTD